MSTTSSFKTTDEYIALFPTEVRERLETIRAIVKEEAPEAVETIKYDMPTYVLNGNMLSIGAFKQHVSIFPISAKMEETIEGISEYKSGEATAKFPMDKPLPLPLIRRMIQIRVEEYRSKGR